MIFTRRHVCTFLRKLCKFPHLESCASDWQFCSEMWLHWPDHPHDTIFWNDHSRKEYFQFGRGKLTTEEAFSVLAGNIIIASVFMYAVAPFTLGVRIYFLIPNKGIWGLAYHFSNIAIFIWKNHEVAIHICYVFLKRFWKRTSKTPDFLNRGKFDENYRHTNLSEWTFPLPVSVERVWKIKSWYLQFKHLNGALPYLVTKIRLSDMSCRVTGSAAE